MLFIILVLLPYTSYCCTCDTTTVCDLLCCCDPECSEADKLSFTCETSETMTQYVPKSTCVSQTFFKSISPDGLFNYSSDNNEYCFTSANPSIAYKSSVKLYPSSITFNHDNNFGFTKLIENKDNITKTEDQTKTYQYHANDPVYMKIGINSYRTLTLISALHGRCIENSVLYLHNTTSTCTTKLTEALCTSGTKIDPTLFDNLILLNNASTVKEVKVSATCYSVDNPESALPQCSATTNTGNTCSNVLRKVELSASHAGPKGIESVELKLYVSNGHALGSRVSIDTDVIFSASSKFYPNPQPAYLRYRSGWTVYFKNKDAKSPRPWSAFSTDTACTDSANVVFPVVQIHSCSKQTGNVITDCAALAQTLLGGLPSAVSKYANADISNPAHWLDIDWNIPQINCSNMPLSSNLLIKYRSFGNKLYPENEIVSVQTILSSADITTLNIQELLKKQVIFYSTVQFASLDAEVVSGSNFVGKLSASIPDYNVPTILMFVCVAVFILLAALIVLRDQSKPEF